MLYLIVLFAARLAEDGWYPQLHVKKMLSTIDTFFDTLDPLTSGKIQTVQVIVTHVLSSRCIGSPAQPDGAVPDKVLPLQESPPTLIAANPCVLLRVIETEF